MKSQPHFTILGAVGGLLCIISAFVPWWSKNGYAVTGFTGSFAGNAGILTIILGLAALVLAFGPIKKAMTYMRYVGVITAIGAFIHLWRGYKLNAIGWGLMLMLAAAALMLSASWIRLRQERK